MASAVAQEKWLAHVTLHPDDLVELLFWGVDDDITALQFKLKLHWELQIVLSWEDFEAFVRNHMTVSEVIAFCLAKASGTSSGDASERTHTGDNQGCS